MPLPKPKKNEKKESFISRFMTNQVAEEEFPTMEQRVAVAYEKWESKGKKKKK